MAKQPSKKQPAKKPATKKQPIKKQSVKKQPILKKVEKKEEEWKSPHKSFKRTYREDYLRDLEVPGIMHHIFATFKMIFKNWKLFLPFLVLMVVASIALVGIMNEETYQKFQEAIEQTSAQTGAKEIGNFAKAGLVLFSVIATGIFTNASSEAAVIFGIIMFLVIWLVTIFIVRYRLAKREIKLRDALFNAMTPLISSFVIFVVAVVQCIPIILLVIALSAAVQTNFLATPFYALLFLAFAILMIITSAYLLSSSLIALVAVSAPGLYPIRALKTASELMMGRRIRFVLRLIALIIVIGLMWFIVMMPLILFDFGMKNFAWTSQIPFIPICLLVMTYFTMIYVSVYLYLYYRWLLKN